MATTLIRVCTAGDLPAVLDLMVQLGDVAEAQVVLSLEHLHRLYDDMARHPDIYLNLVAESEGKVAGFISLIFYKTFFHHGGTALINELIVDRAWRGAGIGGALLERARAEAIDRGMDELEVGTERTNEPAQRFYHKHGFDEEYVLLGMEFSQ